MNTLSKRNSGVDLLKIISVMMISSSHFISKGILYNVPFGSINTIFARIILSMVSVSINILILSTGYFSVTSKGINIRRIVDIILMVATFSGISYVIYACLGEYNFNIKEFIKYLFPYMFYNHGYWFIRIYFELIFIAPFLNIVLTKLNKKSYLFLLIITFIPFSLLSSFNKAFQSSGGFDIIHFTFIYILGGFIRLHLHHFPRKSICFFGYLGFSIVTFLFSIYANNLGYWAYDFVTLILQSVMLFLTFVQFKFNSKFISNIAKSSLAIFATENSIKGLYTDIMKVEEFYYSKYFLLHFICCIILFTTFAFTIDIIRRIIFKHSINKLLDKITILNKRYFTNIEN